MSEKRLINPDETYTTTANRILSKYDHDQNFGVTELADELRFLVQHVSATSQEHALKTAAEGLHHLAHKGGITDVYSAVIDRAVEYLRGLAKLVADKREKLK